MARLIVVSNRLPMPRCGSSGGLVIGLEAALRAAGGLWVGWSGACHEDEGDRAALVDLGPFAMLGVDLPRADLEGYCDGFANQALWPLCHRRLDLARWDADGYRAYRRVSRGFAEWVCLHRAPGDRVWVHDYHLMPLGAELRRQGHDGPIGFFLHVPFPPREIFAALPWARELVETLAAYDLIGFQTTRDWWNFCDFAVHELDAVVTERGDLDSPRAHWRTGVHPIGIDPDDFASMAAAAPDRRGGRPRGSGDGARRRLVGVDRLDCTKGVPERLRAFETLLAEDESARRRLQLTQVSAPSRETLPHYVDLEREVEEIVGRINARFGDLEHAPVCLVDRSLGQAVLAALYRHADVGLVTPLADGMSLVAKEYVAAQDPADPGVLVLSRFAGAAELLEDALPVNPHDVPGMAATIRTALAMPLDERRARWRSMMTQIDTYDIHHWWRTFLADLERPARRPIVLSHRVA
jgi:trehalose 6-phosphate synthase